MENLTETIIDKLEKIGIPKEKLKTNTGKLHRAGPYQPSSPPRWNSLCRGEGAYPPRSFNQSASTRRAQLSVAGKTVRSADLLNDNVKTWVNTD